jgi:hypothetical protein
MADTSEEKSVNEKLKIGLKKMIKSFESYIKEENDLEQLEDNLKHMEETDEKFHKLVFLNLTSTNIDFIKYSKTLWVRSSSRPVG